MALKIITDAQPILETLHRQPIQDDNSDIFVKLIKMKQHILAKGDDAILGYTQEFDGVDTAKFTMKVAEKEIDNAYRQVPKAFIKALKKAKLNLTRYHKYQKPKSWLKKKKNGIAFGMQYKPIEKVGLYVPGGRAPYPSTVLMNAIPAKLANVPNIVMVTPPQKDGSVAPQVLVAADLCGVSDIYKVGGAQAIFGITVGTQTLPKVDKIVGPGNVYVNTAKQMVYGTVDIDKPAGPSEVLVYIQEKKYAAFAAAELLAQLEHDPDAIAIGLSEDKDILDAINEAFTAQLTACKRKDIIEQSAKNAVLILGKDEKESIRLMNEVASEHLVLMVDDYRKFSGQINHAGAIFLGPYTPVTLGDYIAGPNHVLPTGRSARFSSPLNVLDFMKFSSILGYSKKQLGLESGALEILTEMEGFDAHYNAVKIRLS
ncbi:MAG: histidinol dehydrogenase [Candidatus Marinamargulisbacteria bacterium]|jgi:histidinol dehydrogenase